MSTLDKEVEGDQHNGEEQEGELVREEDTRSNVCTLKSDLTVLQAFYSAPRGTCLLSSSWDGARS